MTFHQDVWWKQRDGLTVLIDNMDESHRANTAAMLLRNAVRHYQAHKLQVALNVWWAYEIHAIEKDYLDGWYSEPIPTLEDIRAEPLGPREAEEWVQSTALYKRLA